MSKQTTNLFIGAVALCAATETFAQYTPPPPPTPFPGFLNEYLRKNDPYMSKWDFGGQARMRYEVKDQFGIAGVPGSVDFRDTGPDNENDYWLEKIRFRAGYTDKWFSVFAEGRSSLAQSDDRWASTGPVARKGEGPEQDSIDLHQAYVTVGNHKEFPVSLKVGRQEFIYGDERLVGAFGWNNIGRVFDAVKGRWQNPWFGADFFTSQVVIPEDGKFNVKNDYDYFSGFYGNTTKVPKNTLEFYFLARNASSQAATAEPSPQAPQPGARDIYTPGIRIKSLPGEFGNWDYTGEFMGQFGRFVDTRAGLATAPRNQDHIAYALAINGGYTFNDAFGKPRVALEYAHGSGDSNPRDDKHETFENLFPTNHKFYGGMDLVSLQNIHNIRGIFQLKPHSRVSMAVEGHGFWLADTSDNFYNVGGAPRGGRGPSATSFGVNPSYSDYVGAEIDVTAGVALTRFAQLELGYGHFFVGDYIKQSLAVPGAVDANWFYLQLTVNF